MSHDAVDRLGRAISTPVATMSVVIVESFFHAGEIIRTVIPRIEDRPWAQIELPCLPGQAGTVLKKARKTTVNWPPEAGVLFLADHTPPERSQEDGVEFWRAMNLQRENWSGLNCHLVFLLTPRNYDQLLTVADHLASWIPIKLDARRPAQEGLTYETRYELLPRRSIRNRQEARQRLEELDRGLRETLAEDEAVSFTTLLRRYYLPMIEAALDANDFERADSIRAAVNPDEIPDSDKSRWWSAVFEVFRNLHRAEEMIREAEQYLTWVQQTNNVSETGHAFNALGLALSLAGRRKEALVATQDAVRAYRELARQQPEVFLPDLAASLSNLGNFLSTVARWEEALAATQEAVSIRRELARQQPDAFLPDLTKSLNNLGNRLSEVGHRDEALAATQEAVNICRELAYQKSKTFLPDLATSLNNLGKSFSEVGRREEALAVIQEAVSIHRELARQQPEAFLPELAGSLNNLGISLGKVGRYEEALAVVQETVSIRRELAQHHPDAILPDLAMSLNNLGICLSIVGRREEAMAAIQEAVSIRRELTKEKSDAFLPDLAMSLNNLGIIFTEAGRSSEALDVTQEAVSIYRNLARMQPDAFLPDLATTLGAIGYINKDLGNWTQALSCFEEGVAHLLPFFEQHPAAFLPLMRGLVSSAIETALSGNAELSETTLRARQLLDDLQE